jgi:hypothetical protein
MYMKIFYYALALCYTFSLFGKCPAMRNGPSKEKKEVTVDNNVTLRKKPNPEKIYNIYDPINYKFSVNGNKFQNLSTARKYMMMLQEEGKKDGRKLEVIKLNSCTFKVVSKDEAKEQFTLLEQAKNECNQHRDL